jgi:hypothetical protein
MQRKLIFLYNISNCRNIYLIFFNACENRENLWRLLLLFVQICRLRSNYQEGEGWEPLTGLAPPHLFACPKPRPWFPMPYIMVFLYVQWFEAWCGCSFVDIGGIVDHRWLNFLFIAIYFYNALVILLLIHDLAPDL